MSESLSAIPVDKLADCIVMDHLNFNSTVREYGSESVIMPYLLLGPPEVGIEVGVKEAVEKICKKRNYERIDYEKVEKMTSEESNELIADIKKIGKEPFIFADLKLFNHEIIDFTGVQVIGELLGGKVARFIPPVAVKLCGDYQGCMFLNGFTSITDPAMKRIFLKLIYSRTLAHTKLHEKMYLIASGNPADQKSLEIGLRSRLRPVNVAYTSPK